MKKVLVIGGGVIGQFTAYYLSTSGHDVTIIDDAPKMPPASVGNCGLITPSHIVPINSWSTIWKGLKWLGKTDAPFAIKPQFDRNFISWFFSFAWHARKGSIANAIQIRHELLQQSRILYEAFFEDEPNRSEWKTEGLLYACHTERGMSAARHEVALLEKHDLESRILTKDQLRELEPAISEKSIGGAIFETDGWIKPGKLLEDIQNINRKNGVTLVCSKVLDFEFSQGKIQKIHCEEGTHEADEYILCAGARSQPLARKLGIRLALIPGKGYSLTADTPINNQPIRPVVMLEKMVVATPWETGFRLGSTMEFSGFDLKLNEKRLNALKAAATDYLAMNLSEATFAPWAGWRPMTSNGLPIIERPQAFSNLIIAAGHGLLGLSMAPATGKLVDGLV